jgi:Ca2+:H+ antiporter
MAFSVAIAAILLVIYAAYIAFGIFGLEGRRGRVDHEGPVARSMVAEAAGASRWPVWVSLLILAIATIALVPVVDVLTTSVTPVTSSLGWSEVFVGMVIVANAGNAAEAYAAIRFALQRPASPSPGVESGLDLSMSIASASSIQIATFVLPVVVLYSLFEHPMSLAFSGVEVAILGLLAIIFGAISHDGEANWLEGAQLLALYAMAAVVFFALPASALRA